MHIEVDKKERRLELKFGIAKLERELFNFLKKQLVDLMNSVNNFHSVKSRVKEKLEMKTYAIKKETWKQKVNNETRRKNQTKSYG